MKIDRANQPKSSFLAVEKDLSIIVSEILNNDRLKRLLFYTSKDALTRPNLTQEQSIALCVENIKMIPKITMDEHAKVFFVLKFNNFMPNVRNPEFRDNIIEFDIVCPFEQWELTDFQQRPYKIAAEIDTMFNKKHLTGIGILQFVSGEPFVLTEQFGGFCLRYKAIHGEEDKTPMPTLEQEKLLMEDFYPGLLD